MSNKFEELFNSNNKILASPYDKRDYKFSDQVPVGAFNIPQDYITPEPLYIFNQGRSSECAACSFTGIRYMQEQNQSKISIPFSPSFTYANRIDGEDFEGMYIRSVCDKGREGTLPYDLFPGFYTYPECKSKFLANKDKYLEEAKPFAITSYYQCNTRIAMQQAIMMYKGILAGWRTDKVTGKLYWRLVNSWGTEYGNNGIVWIPEEYPMIENPYAIVDENPGMIWESYKEKYNL